MYFLFYKHLFEKGTDYMDIYKLSLLDIAKNMIQGIDELHNLKIGFVNFVYDLFYLLSILLS